MTTATTEVWHHYGRARAASDDSVPDTFHWAWSQDRGPGPEMLGILTGKIVADLGSGAARQAAHLATHHRPGRVDAIESSPAQHTMAAGLYAALAPRLHLVHADAVTHLHTAHQSYDVLYSVFGATCFSDPARLLPAAAAALRPGGRLVFATFGHYLSGAAASEDVTPVHVPAKAPDGTATTMHRWVLRPHVWGRLLDAVGLTDITTDVLAAGSGPRAAETLLISAFRGR
ncbi:class I SAM-dependent methyltransferase [Streptomyces sp. NPDC051940]|uniref:class I SAM-dependent methyltransferase n=1 Tax=Streptomyces sp. NPDC051940 TaxID=3155675 RepID=UPI00342714C3